ncbi:unnamed protein product [Durusdinium trenchii]|uniref:Acetyl-CoA carboxylase n=1 Tax=Durusdinium trenchii TaxID=1381693 RepID=A0ABP0RWC7_9DINO
MIGAKLLKLVWSAYFDDFLSLTTPALSRHTDICISVMFQLLGWETSVEKLVPFNTCCKVLGVQLDLGQSVFGKALVSNTKDRSAELTDEIDSILACGRLKRHDGERLRGRLQFASGQLFGRKFRLLLSVLNRHVSRGWTQISDDLRQALVSIRSRLVSGLSRVIDSRYSDFVHIYVDASFCPGGYSGVGGVLYDSSGDAQNFFSFRVPDEWLASMSSEGAKVVIQELEGFAALLALREWRMRRLQYGTSEYQVNLIQVTGDLEGAVMSSAAYPQLLAEVSHGTTKYGSQIPGADPLKSYVNACGGKQAVRRILVASNGMAAAKVMMSMRQWAHMEANLGSSGILEFVAMATKDDLDANAEFIRLADKHVEVPPGKNVNNYANVDLICKIAQAQKVDAVWPGWGHASENPKLPAKLKDLGIHFIGPTSPVMSVLGDKIAAGILAQTAGVPSIPWSGDGLTAELTAEGTIPEETFKKACLTSVQQAVACAERIGFPVMLKASEGGGGKGIRMSQDKEELEQHFVQVRSEVPGSPVFMMQLCTGARHIEVQIVGDQPPGSIGNWSDLLVDPERGLGP